MSRKRKQAEVIAEGSGEVDVQALAEAMEAVEVAEAEVAAEPVPVPVSVPESEPEISAAADAFEEAEAEAVADVEIEPEDDAEGATLPAASTQMDDAQLEHLVEALIFASDKPVTLQRLRQLTRVSDVRRLEQALGALAERYQDRGIALQQVSGGYQMRTASQFSAWVQQLIAGRPVRLSRAQLETLAIIAYRQPITRPEIDEIRGVDSSNTLRVLTDRSLIRILGKKEEVGRPLLYGTTKEFLDFFSLGDLRELPTLREYSELTAESRKVMSDRLGVELETPVASPEGEPAMIDDPALIAHDAEPAPEPPEPPEPHDAEAPLDVEPEPEASAE